MGEPATETGFSLRRRRTLQALGCLGALGWARAGADEPIRFGLTPVFLDDQVGFLGRWRWYLEGRLERPLQFVQRRSYDEILQLLLEGRIDFSWLCGYPYWRHRHRLALVSVPVYEGAPLYRAYLIRHAEDPHLQDLNRLRGRTFAYSDPDSNSGYLYVRHRLQQQGLDPATLFGRSFFTLAHRRVIEAVAVRLADAGAVDGYVWDVLSRRAPGITDDTRVIERSDPFGFPPVVASRHLAPTLSESMQRVLNGMHRDTDGRALLAELALDRFETAAPDLYEDIGRMADGVA
ncbi:ABC transporter substrate-binding protein [Ectothiorhodospira shaposhnikovii]|uniref:substrate-binding domain-containing protein n=1 Tax=Ectothiorhodospira shaposhnikovii TaxID=1054 RepID=UPI001903F7AE|nr:PhnD/SsuA/transferrin family substrate-binding protein [Ectothiorhodospira shaposhnikovii]MBK1672168.1 ABC transporter substrate-binding protein [Ectothiorhodospira shaposhnikovii]